MVRQVGTQARSEFILDPAEAWRRGREIDRMLKSVWPTVPVGVTRGSHRRFNELDDQRQLEQARRLNVPPSRG